MNKSSYITNDPPNSSRSRTVICSVCKFYNTYSAGGVFLHWMNEYPHGCLSHSIPLNEDKEQGEFEEDFSTKPGRNKGCILGLAEIQSCSKSSQDT